MSALFYHHANACQILAHQNHLPTYPVVIGVDEVGRGALFGQMTVGAVILDPSLTGEFGQLDLTDTPLSFINDSKKLSAKKREQLITPIKTLSQSYALVDVPVCVIDKIDIYQATLLGMTLAIERLIELNQLCPSDVCVVIDGNAVPILPPPLKQFQSCLATMVGGDGIHSSIACASILAKVHRDDAMMTYAKHYPQYHLDKNKGYGSVKHRQAIELYGILAEHRKTFNPVKSMLLHDSPS